MEGAVDFHLSLLSGATSPRTICNGGVPPPNNNAANCSSIVRIMSRILAPQLRTESRGGMLQ